MAILQEQVNDINAFEAEIGGDLAPAGTFVATILDVQDLHGVQRQKFQSTGMETLDLTAFLFGFQDSQGAEHKIASRRMRISGNEKSHLYAFLKSVLGRAPAYGWDYLELRGTQCLLTVEHIQRRDGAGVYARIAALAPVTAGMVGNGATVSGKGQGAGGAAQPRPSPVGQEPATATTDEDLPF